MCRSIKTLRPPLVEDPTDVQMREAALQYVRKISGYRVPSQANAATFDQAVSEVEEATRRLLAGLSHRSAASRPAG
jgi:hypothetical protein